MLLFACGGEENQADQLTEELNDALETITEEIPNLEEEIVIYDITNDKAGDFGIGDAIPTSSDDYMVEEKTVLIQSEEGPYEETIHSVSNTDEELMVITPEYDYETGEYTDNIGEINVYSDRFQTAEGIGVGSSLEEFMETYTDFSIWYTYVSDMYVIETEQYNAQFILDGKGFEGDIDSFAAGEMFDVSASDFDLETRIVTVRMFKGWEE